MASLFEKLDSDLRFAPETGSMGWGGVQARRCVKALDFTTLDEGMADVKSVADQLSEHLEETKASAVSERATQMRVMVDAARQDALIEAKLGFEQELEERLTAERDRVAQVCAEFSGDRQRYFGTAETQVVKLALAVAERVLGRELSSDEIPMRAMVKAALTKIRDGSETVLRVRSAELQVWSEMLTDQPVNVIADDRVGTGEVVLETGVGRVELGVEMQLAEIERGFRELMQRQGS